jgi:hypothetical protein
MVISSPDADPEPDLVWYACYGSNLLRSRFMTYIQGGTPLGAATGQVGCTDPTPPRADRALRIPHRLYFAGKSAKWQNKGVAFVARERDPSAGTAGRAYLISREQFLQVALQENGFHDFGMDPKGEQGGMGDDPPLGIDLEETRERGWSEFPGGLYSVLLFLGEYEGYPTYTFTTSRDRDQLPLNPPGQAYRTTIVRGLRETYDWPQDEIDTYLASAGGAPKG